MNLFEKIIAGILSLGMVSVVVMFVVVVVIACSGGSSSHKAHKQHHYVQTYSGNETYVFPQDSNSPSNVHKVRVGVSTSGKVGIELAPNVVMTPDGKIGLGIGL